MFQLKQTILPLGGFVLLQEKRKSMPVQIPDDLPAGHVLRVEEISVIAEHIALAQDIRPLRIAIVNLMPRKIVAETQLLRLLSHSPLQVTVTLVRFVSHTSKNTPVEYLARFYKDFDAIASEKFDGVIITGAPVETIEFDEVTYWSELQSVMAWSRSHAYSTMHICWGAQAGLYYHYGIEKHPLPEKMFGVFAHTVTAPTHPLMRGFDETFLAPHSRHTGVSREAIMVSDKLTLLAESSHAGVYAVASQDGRQVFITGHPEYDRETLGDEYRRDCGKGLTVSVPVNYFPGDNPEKMPAVTWRAHAQLLFTNWLNDIYAQTPFDLQELKPPE